MTGKNRIIGYFFTFLATILILLSFSLSGNAQTLYSCEAPFDDQGPFLHTINPNTGDTLSTVEIILGNSIVRGCNGMAQDPTTGVCYMILNVTEPETINPRVLAVINPFTGRAFEIGNTGEAFSSITFDSSGTLYGVVGDQGNKPNPVNPETLFTINKNTAQPTFVQILGNGGDGEVIGFNPNDGLIYHASREVFESVNPNTGVVTPILDDYKEITALLHQTGNVFLVGDFEDLETITTSGVQQDIGDLDHSTKGLAFDCVAPPVPPIPTLSEWGLIALAGILGIVGFMVIRRRKAVA